MHHNYIRHQQIRGFAICVAAVLAISAMGCSRIRNGTMHQWKLGWNDHQRLAFVFDRYECRPPSQERVNYFRWLHSELRTKPNNGPFIKTSFSEGQHPPPGTYLQGSPPFESEVIDPVYKVPTFQSEPPLQQQQPLLPVNPLPINPESPLPEILPPHEIIPPDNQQVPLPLELNQGDTQGVIAGWQSYRHTPVSRQRQIVR